MQGKQDITSKRVSSPPPEKEKIAGVRPLVQSVVKQRIEAQQHVPTLTSKGAGNKDKRKTFTGRRRSPEERAKESAKRGTVAEQYILPAHTLESPRRQPPDPNFAASASARTGSGWKSPRQQPDNPPVKTTFGTRSATVAVLKREGSPRDEVAALVKEQRGLSPQPRPQPSIRSAATIGSRPPITSLPISTELRGRQRSSERREEGPASPRKDMIKKLVSGHGDELITKLESAPDQEVLQLYDQESKKAWDLFEESQDLSRAVNQREKQLRLRLEELEARVKAAKAELKKTQVELNSGLVALGRHEEKKKNAQAKIKNLTAETENSIATVHILRDELDKRGLSYTPRDLPIDLQDGPNTRSDSEPELDSQELKLRSDVLTRYGETDDTEKQS